MTRNERPMNDYLNAQDGDIVSTTRDPAESQIRFLLWIRRRVAHQPDKQPIKRPTLPSEVDARHRETRS